MRKLMRMVTSAASSVKARSRNIPRRASAVAAALALAATTLAAPPAWASGTSPAKSSAPASAIPNGAKPTGLGPSPARVSPDPASQSAAAAKALAAAESSASAQAYATGKPVPIPAETTDRTEVAANPDGTFTLTSNAQPVRVQRDGVWQPIDTDLVRAADGSYSPAAAADTVVFSGGGTDPMVSLTDPATGDAVSLGWPGALPAPAVTGDAALYPNVLPGVDLRLTASATGYSEVLVVHDAAAAADPGLAHLRFTLTAGHGAKISTGADGSVTASDGKTGDTIFSGGRPLMWDSSHSSPIGAAPGPDGAGSGRITEVPTVSGQGSAGSTTLSLAPPASALTGVGVKYPIYVDPEMTGGRNYYVEVASFGGKWNTTTNSTSVGSGIVELGDCGYSSCFYNWNGTDYYSYVMRDYFQMNTSTLAARNGVKAVIHSATFNIQQTGNSNSCTAQQTNLYSAGGISSSTSWPGPLNTYQSDVTSAAGGGSSCAAANDAFNALPFTQSANGSTNLTFGLAAPSETNELQYKTFSDNPSLTIVYNFAPLKPTAQSVNGAVTCTSTTYESAAKPTFNAKAADNNPSPLDVKLNYTVDNSTGTTTIESGTASEVASNTNDPWTGGTALTNDTAYEFKASATNIVPSGTGGAPAETGPDSGWYAFTSLSALPSAAPTVDSTDFPADQWGQSTGAPGVFTVGTGGAAKIAGFAYSFDGGSDSEPVPATSDCAYQNDGGLGTSRASTGSGNTSGLLEVVSGSTVQIRVPAGLAVGRHTLYVRSFDDAHNASAESSYVFYVAPDYQTASQPTTIIDSATLDTALSGTNASEIAVQTDCCGVTWYGSQQIIFNNATQNGTFTVSFHVPDAGTWDLGTDLTLSTDYGQLAVKLDGSTYLANSSAAPIDAYSPAVSLRYVDLGTPYLTAGTHTLTFTTVGKNASSTSYKAGLDYIELSPTNRYEAETLGSSAPTAGSLAVQAGNAWSDGQQLMLTNTTVGASFTVSFDAPVESDYALGVNLTEADDYGQVRFDLDPSSTDINLDDSATTPIDAYNTSVTTKYVFLGGVHLTAGTHVLKLTVVGTNSASVNNRYNAGVDYVEAVPVTGATDASFTAAMNNYGIISDNTTTTGPSFDGGSGNLSLQTMEAAGITPGTATAPGATFSLGGATFTMPQLRTDSSGAVIDDNVIPDGQTIPLPNESAQTVALLAASTCGSSPAGNATINYTNASPQSSQPAITSVPDWISGSASTAALTLAYRDDGTDGSVPKPGAQPHLYEIMLPVNPNGTLSSITLPTFSPTFLSCSGDLHILAIGIRSTASVPTADSGGAWVGAYAAPMDEAIDPVGGSFSNETIREVIQPSVTGSGYVQLRLSNAHASGPVTFDAVTLAAQSSGPATLATPVAVDFGTSASVTIPAGGDATSAPVALPSTSGGTGSLVISLHIEGSPAPAVTSIPIHDTLNQASYYVSGNDTLNTDGTVFTAAQSLQGMYYLSGLDVSDATSTDGTVEVLGDQTAAAAPSWTPNTWPAAMPAAFSADSVSLPGGVANDSTGGPTAPTDWWHLGEDSGTTAYDAGSGYDNLTLDGATWTTDNPNTGTSTGSLTFNGTSQYAATSTAAIDTSGSFTVSAWVKLSSTTANQTVAAQSGTHDSGFYLGYQTANGGQWALYFTTADATSPTYQAEATSTNVTAGTWTHLLGMYNASTKTATLYIDGVAGKSATGVTAWKASGDLTLGRDLTNGSAADYFDGEISDVRLWNSVLPGAQISEVYHDGGAGTLTTANALSTFEQTAEQEPNVRDVVLSVGANDVLDGVPAATIESNLTSLITGVEAQYVQNQTDKPVQVFITTILPLGLPSGDARESTRESVNAWITSTYQNGLSPDIATAVADPSSISQINPTYLSGGVPTAAYYTEIASVVAADIQNAIPPISLARSRFKVAVTKR